MSHFAVYLCTFYRSMLMYILCTASWHSDDDKKN